MRRFAVLLTGLVAVLGVVASQTAAAPGAPDRQPQRTAATAPVPTVTPTPRHISRIGADLRVPHRVRVFAGRSVDKSTQNVVTAALRAAGARDVDVVTGVPARPDRRPGTLSVMVGSLADANVPGAASRLGAARNRHPEGYGLVSRSERGHGAVLLAGADADGTFYAAQTFRQLAGNHRIAAVSVADEPSMPLRGAIEGFYGAPWSHAARLDQLRFYGTVKMNTYVYTPKDDPYLRERWRQEYPDAKLAQLRELVDTARANHVKFTYAVSPGLSICYSDPADVQALERKLDSVYRLGVRSFSIPLDDISYDEWNCAQDEDRYGAPSPGAAGQAQVDLLNTLQHDFIGSHAGAQPLQTVPTEYSDVEDSPYKKAIREQLDPAVLVMWTGVGVIPTAITTEQARQADAVWGRKVFVWDNYPVNDYDKTEGRLLLAPYDKRDPGLSEELSGVVLNPMVQSHPSKVALFGAADYSWNDTAYDPARGWRAAADYFSGGDPKTTEALLAFFDTQHFAPSSTVPWQPQAPALARKIDAFDAAFHGSAAQRHAAVDDLRGYQKVLAGASERIRSHVGERGFLRECKPWLDALALWGDAFGHTLDGLDAKVDGRADTARREFAAANELAGKAGAVHTIPGTTRPQGPVRVADGVLDEFIATAPQR